MTPASKTKQSRPDTKRRRDDATRLAKALGHPLRTAIMVELNQRTASPVALARALGESVGSVSYHVRILLELDCIELVDTRPRRGALEHFYRATTRAELRDEAWENLSPANRRAFALQWFREAFADISQAIDADPFTSSDVHFSLTQFELDEAGWAEINEQLQEVIDRALELHAEAAPQDGAKRRGRLVLAQFEPAPGPVKRAARKGR